MSGAMTRIRATRHRIRSTRAGRITLKVAAAVVGGAVIAVGIVLLPLPGPGWLIIFAGLGILASEYEWAARLLRFAKDKVSSWTAWVAHRSRPVQIVIAAAGLALVAGLVAAAWWYYTG